MNIELLTEIAEWLEAGAPHETEQAKGATFHMDYVKKNINELYVTAYANLMENDWITPSCGTVMCIAGATLQFSGIELNHFNMSKDMIKAGEILELDTVKYQTLFEPWDYYKIGAEDITPAMAAKTIRNLIETGEVVWPAKKI